jgi:hypothetical protein
MIAGGGRLVALCWVGFFDAALVGPADAAFPGVFFGI